MRDNIMYNKEIETCIIFSFYAHLC